MLFRKVISLVIPLITITKVGSEKWNSAFWPSAIKLTKGLSNKRWKLESMVYHANQPFERDFLAN